MKSVIFRVTVIVLALGGLGIASGQVLGPTVAAPSAGVPQPSKEDADAYYAIGKSFEAADAVTAKAKLAAASDPVKLCSLSEAHTRSFKARLAREQAFLHSLQTAGKPTQSLIGLYLATSESVDRFTINQVENCLAARFGGDDPEMTILYVQELTAQLATIKGMYRDAQATNNSLIVLGALQSQQIYYEEIIRRIEILEGADEVPTPPVTALIARLPDLKAGYGEIWVLNSQKVHAYTDPDGVRYGPYVFKPMAFPALPESDDVMEKSITKLIMQALMPSIQAAKAMQAGGNKSSACGYAKHGTAELRRLKAFADAYRAQQVKAGKPTVVAENMLSRVRNVTAQAQDVFTDSCRVDTEGSI